MTERERELTGLVEDFLDLLECARSGYIGGCKQDIEWDERRDTIRNQARALLSRTTEEEGK